MPNRSIYLAVFAAWLDARRIQCSSILCIEVQSVKLCGGPCIDVTRHYRGHDFRPMFTCLALCLVSEGVRTTRFILHKKSKAVSRCKVVSSSPSPHHGYNYLDQMNEVTLHCLSLVLPPLAHEGGSWIKTAWRPDITSAHPFCLQ